MNESRSETQTDRATLEAIVRDLQQQVVSLHLGRRRAGVRQAWLVTLACCGTLLWSLASGPVGAQQSESLPALVKRVAALEATARKTGAPPFVLSPDGTTYVLTGFNLQIVSGSRKTDGPINGRGNLIVGYNELRTGAKIRTGSHNLVVGIGNNYSSYGGLVAGNYNTISGPLASVSGGFKNTASGGASSVSGGTGNTAEGNTASVSGGFDNTASGGSASVSGGFQNTASGETAAVSGGLDNTASGGSAAVSGGFQNTASGETASVSGGTANNASGVFAHRP